MDIRTPSMWMVTGERGAGKTTFCRSLAAHAHSQGWNVAGLLSPAVFEGETKTGILAEDVHTGETRTLASDLPHFPFELQLGKWYFDPDTLTWGNRVIERSITCDLLILDELGPLEFAHQGGWQAAFDVLRSDGYQIALVVVRPELQSVAHQHLTFSETIKIDRTQTLSHLVRRYWRKITANG